MKKPKWILNYVFILVFMTACSAGGADDGERGPVFIDSTELLIMESFPVQISVHVVGSLPTPCHQFGAEVEGPDAQNRIDVTVYSMEETEMSCIQVLGPFDETIPIPMQGQNEGTYLVYVNGEFAGEFTYPG